jgi:hypothetical protein
VLCRHVRRHPKVEVFNWQTANSLYYDRFQGLEANVLGGCADFEGLSHFAGMRPELRNRFRALAPKSPS